MSVYKFLLESGKEDDAFIYYDKEIKSLEKVATYISYSSFIGGIITLVVITRFYNEVTASWCALAGGLLYLLGYQHCSALWRQEKEKAEYYKAIEEHAEEDN